MIRQATSDDIPRLMAVGEAFWKLSPLSEFIPLDDIAVCEVIERAIENGSCFVGEKGVIMGFLIPHWANPAYKVALEFAWYGAGEGDALLEAFETWAKENGAIGVQMATVGASYDDKIEAKLIKSGYTLAERGFFKRVN
jgi:GNAT superfamily N-acetyltransferase